MTESASQHLDGLGTRTASLWKRSWSSARCGWFLVRLARSCSRMLPGDGASHTLMAGSVAPKFELQGTWYLLEPD
jgi:hypothetical protein